jgi:predicted  nucleic acid-binding Zn-ribbon protein
MLPILEQLLVLQDRDCRILQLKAELARIPHDLAAVDARMSEETNRLDALRSRLKTLETERKKLEIDAESKRTQINKYRTQLFQIKSNTEYQALLKEISNHESEIRAIEDKELDLMDQVEQLQPQLREEQETVKQIAARAGTERQSLQTRSKRIETELAALESERAALTQNCDPGVLARYNRLMRSKGDVALVPIRHGNCGGCHLNLPAQVAHDVHFGPEPMSCQYCGRILYWPGD